MTVERRRRAAPELPPASAPNKASRRTGAKAAPLPTYVNLPRPVCYTPPLGKGGLGVFEFVAAAAVLACGAVAQTTPVIVSRQLLLRVGGLAVRARTRAKVNAALLRLRNPVGPFPPVLLSIQKVSARRWALTINPAWRPKQNFVAVPFPLPTDGRRVLALYLHSCQFTLASKFAATNLKSLTRHLGLSRRPSHARRELAAALVIVNEFRDVHLAAEPLIMKENDNGELKITTASAACQAAAQTGQSRRRSAWNGTKRSARRQKHPSRRQA